MILGDLSKDISAFNLNNLSQFQDILRSYCKTLVSSFLSF